MVKNNDRVNQQSSLTLFNINYLDTIMEDEVLMVLETPEGISDKMGFYIVCYIVLLGDMSRGIIFPSLWPLIQSLNGTVVTQSYVVAAFSFGRILVSPMFGKWSTYYGYKHTLIFSCSILLLGTILYSQVLNVGHSGFLILSQLISGVGTGTLGVTRAYVADITPERYRTTYMAYLTTLQYAGFAVTPLIGSLYSTIYNDNDDQNRWNIYSATSLTMTFLTAIAITVLVFKFQNRVPESRGRNSRHTATASIATDRVCFRLITRYDATILGCLLLNIAAKGCIGSFEALGVEFAESYFDMVNSTTGFIIGTCGAIGCMTLLSMGYLLSKYKFNIMDTQLIVFGFISMSMGIISLVFLKDDTTNANWRYELSMFLIYSIGYPIGHTAVIGLFSKIVGRRPQGLLLGWFASAGSFARITFPLISGYITYFQSVQSTFIFLTITSFLATLFTIRCKNTLRELSS